MVTKKETYLMIKAGTRVAELSDILDRLFKFRSRKGPNRRRYLAEKILRRIRRDGSLSAERWEEIVQELGTSPTEYYAVLNKLEAAGMIRKGRGHHKGEWVLSREFAYMLKDMAEYWMSWAFGVERGRDNI